MKDTQEINLWREIESRQALGNLVLDSAPSLAHLIKRVDLREVNCKNICVIVFSHPIGKKEWELKEKAYLENMRRLYKERNLKNKCVFHKVLVEVDYKLPIKENITPKYTYRERATGDFEIHTANPLMIDIFKSIQNIIKERKALEKD
ncbi:hypothetical protein [Helicobacter pullorum]|uniref:hypothetical protein n=1 Tax=Helicobacter pullorum TaxID=35818 RepID=UPI00241CA1E7|nr:hypothetical protein [Helicobacter pullorum]